MKGCDVIFCANVLIYFDTSTKQKVLSAMYDSMNNGGYLFVGCFESLHGVPNAFNLIHFPKAMGYKKGE
jgi:chemotaxis protein methyltransferase CheR